MIQPDSPNYMRDDKNPIILQNSGE